MGASAEQRRNTADRRAKALKFRRAGWLLEDIARALQYSSPAAVSKDLSRALAQAVQVATTNAKELLQLELSRVDRLQAGHWEAAIGGSVRSAAVVLGCIDRRVKLLGLDRIQGDSYNARSVLGELARGLALAASILPEVDDDDGTDRPELDAWDDDEDDDDDQGAGHGH